MHRWQAAVPGRVEMLARAQPGCDRGLHRLLDRARPIAPGDIGTDLVDGVGETETHRRRLRSRLGADLADHFVVVDHVIVEEEHRLTRRVRAVPPRTAGSSWAVRSNRRRADRRACHSATRTRRPALADGSAALAHSTRSAGAVRRRAPAPCTALSAQVFARSMGRCRRRNHHTATDSTTTKIAAHTPTLRPATAANAPLASSAGSAQHKARAPTPATTPKPEPDRRLFGAQQCFDASRSTPQP